MRLERLWDFGPEAKLVAFPETTGCFNSGFFMFRPSPWRQREYQWRLAHPTPPTSCDKGRLGDQSFLNAVYSDRDEPLRLFRQREHVGTHASRRADAERYTAVEASTWASRHPFDPLGLNAIQGGPLCLDSPSKLMAHADSFHFFERFAPWGVNCSLDRVLTKGDACGRVDVLRAKKVDSMCSGHAAAQAVWWTELLRLPLPLRRVCNERLISSVGSRTEANGLL